MEKRKFSKIAIAFAVLIALIVGLLMSNSLRRSSRITLPDAASSAASVSEKPQQQTQNTMIEITPQTVQTAIATLSRPESYVRSMTVEYLWSGGSGTVTTSAAVSGAFTRIDTTQLDGKIRHVITDGKNTYVWYNSQKKYYVGSAGEISSDEEQHLPTYEDVLNLDADQIQTADYRTFSEEDCIYVETSEDDGGYQLRYWVSVSSGLLLGAEKLQDGETVYRMAAQPLSGNLPTTADFTLPDGTVLDTSTN